MKIALLIIFSFIGCAIFSFIGCGAPVMPVLTSIRLTPHRATVHVGQVHAGFFVGGRVRVSTLASDIRRHSGELRLNANGPVPTIVFREVNWCRS